MKKQTRILVDCIREVLVDEPVKKSWLFGSYARGQEKSDSDVDLLVEMEPNNLTILVFLGIQTRLERATKGAIESFRTMGRQCKEVSGGLPTFISPWIDGRKAVDAPEATLPMPRPVTCTTVTGNILEFNERPPGRREPPCAGSQHLRLSPRPHPGRDRL